MKQTIMPVQRVITTDFAAVEDLISSAEEKIIPFAQSLSRGIRVTRVGPGDYVVETAADVECGYTVYADR